MTGNRLDDCVDRLVLRLECIVVRLRSRHGIKFDNYHVDDRIDNQQLAAKSNTRKSSAGGVRKPPETTVGSAAMTGPRRRRGEPQLPFGQATCGTGGANVVHPTFRDDLLAVVASALRHHLPKASHVA